MAVVIEDAVPVLYETWADWRQTKSDPHESEPLIEPGTASCGVCWGQRRTWEPAANGEGLVPILCVACLGRGVVRVEPAT